MIAKMAAVAFKQECLELTKKAWKRRCVIEEEIAVTRAIKRIRTAASHGEEAVVVKMTKFENDFQPVEFNTETHILESSGFEYSVDYKKYRVSW